MKQINEKAMKGGKRIGAGRKKGSNVYGEPTKPMRIPLSLVGNVEAVLKLQASTPVKIPLYASSVSAGIPLPSDATLEEELDLNKKLIKNLAATFVVRANGKSMIDVGIHDRDLLIVDRSIKPNNNDIVVAAYDGDLLVKRLIFKDEETYLYPENKDFKPLKVFDTTEFFIWGVVTNVIHSFK